MATVNMNVQIESEQLDFLKRIGVDINAFFKEAINKRIAEEVLVQVDDKMIEGERKPEFKRSFLGAGLRMDEESRNYKCPTDEEWEKMNEEILEDFKEYLE